MGANESDILFHADDYGITAEQACSILALSTACGGRGVLNSVSIFVNSPAFSECAKLAYPYYKEGSLQVTLHLNLVEGPSIAQDTTRLLVNERGMFCHDFVGLWRMSCGRQADALYTALHTECVAQIERFLEAFPDQRTSLRIDSHQHTHAIPLVRHAMQDALTTTNVQFSHCRIPVEPLTPHFQANRERMGTNPKFKPINLVKVKLLRYLWKQADKRYGKLTENEPLFCGVALSGGMDAADAHLVRAFQQAAQAQDRGVEMLFHPVSVPVEQCLDPQNTSFAKACANPSRDAEAKTLVALSNARLA